MSISPSRATPRRSVVWLASLSVAALACSDADVTGGTALGLAGPESVEATAADVRRSLPMKIRGTVELVSQVDPPPAPCGVFANSVLAGNATHVGRYEGTGNTCILGIAPDPDPPFTPAGPPPYLAAQFANLLWTITAANGDELWLEGAGVAVISAVDGSLRAEGTHTAIGGTGRFAGATGELQSSAVNDDGLGPDDFRSEGWIEF